MPSTLGSKRALSILFLTIILGALTDLGSKSIAFRTIAETPVIVTRAEVLRTDNLGYLIPPHEPTVVIPSVLEFTLVLNPGAVFGIGAGKRWFFIVFTISAIAIALLLFAKWTKPKDWAAHAGFGLIIAGGLGNLYDRVLFGCVRDFIHPFPGVRTPFGIKWPGGNDQLWPYVSNIADLYLIIGIGLLVIHTWRQPPIENTSTDMPDNHSTEPTA
ncbi:MAG: signal peptidase II [Phycisphaerales bacterium]|nr:signal peptidase II [Phycisphaerales bacterium]